MRFRGVLAGLLSVGLVLAANTGVWAAADPDPGRVPVAGASRKVAEAAFVCQGWSNPEPQYSASNSTLHYGGKIICNFIETLNMVVVLYTVVGNGDLQRYVESDRFSKLGKSIEIGDSRFIPCFGHTSTRWIMALYGNGALVGPLMPNPGWTSVKTLPCGDVP